MPGHPAAGGGAVGGRGQPVVGPLEGSIRGIRNAGSSAIGSWGGAGEGGGPFIAPRLPPGWRDRVTNCAAAGIRVGSRPAGVFGAG